MIANITYRVITDGVLLTGTVEVPRGALHLTCDAPSGCIEAIEAQLEIPMDDSERAFFNGYQTWTHCPEYRKHDKIRGLDHVPRSVLRRNHVDRYGDYHFVQYENKPGHFHGFSWCYFRKKDKYRFIGSLDEKLGYTIFRYDANQGLMTIERDCAGVHHPGGELPIFDLYFAEGSEQKVFDGWFKAMPIECTVGEPIKGYSSWYNRFQNINEKSIKEDLAGCKQMFSHGDLFQIDDGWEAHVGDWLEADHKKFPSGMKAMVDEIHEAGFKAGLWLAPFACEMKSEICLKHFDWLLKVNGGPWACGQNWGGFYALDFDNPEVQEYLRSVFDRIFNEWGFDLVKLDFLYAAAPYGNESESRAGRMIRAMQMIREWCGDKLVLGCGVPLMPAFGYVDYCRIGPDVTLNAKGDIQSRMLHRERCSTVNAIDNTIYRRQLNGRAFSSDPDVFLLRDYNIKLSLKNKRNLACVNALYGNVLLTSDDPSRYSDKAKVMFAKLLKMFSADKVKLHCKGAHTWIIRFTVNGKKHKIKIKS